MNSVCPGTLIFHFGPAHFDSGYFQAVIVHMYVIWLVQSCLVSRRCAGDLLYK